MLIPSFFLIAWYGDGPNRRIALMFFFWTHVGAVILLLGFLSIGLTIGSFDFADIDESGIPSDVVIIAAVAKLATKGIINFLLFFVEKNNNETAKTNSSALNTSRDIIKVDSCSVLNFKIKFNIWLSNNKLISNAIFNITNEIIYPLFIR